MGHQSAWEKSRTHQTPPIKLLVNGVEVSASGRSAIYNFSSNFQITLTSPETANIEVIGAPPTGAAGGVLIGTYPNPSGLAATGVTPGTYKNVNVTVGADGRISFIEELDPSSGDLFEYRAKTSATSGDPASGYMLWNNATQTSATSLSLSDIAHDGTDLTLRLGEVASGDVFIIQDLGNAANFQKWNIGTPTDNTTYWAFAVTLDSSGGTGTTNFSNNENIAVFWYHPGSGGGGSVTLASLAAVGIFSPWR